MLIEMFLFETVNNASRATKWYAIRHIFQRFPFLPDVTNRTKSNVRLIELRIEPNHAIGSD